MQTSNTLLGAALVVLVVLIGACTFLVYGDKIDGETFMAVVVGPAVGGLIGFVAGAKGVQQGSQATVSPPPDA
jgi:hypothetical protein